MTEKLTYDASVTYGDVDRREVLLLPRLFKLLQEGAITHANQFGTGTEALIKRGETWVLNRIAVTVERYPGYEEALRLETWSSGIKGFKGYRDFRVYDAQKQLVISASSLWVYVNVVTKSVVRVPRDLAAAFPVCTEGVSHPELEAWEFEPPAAGARVVPVSLRYSDFDVNEHVNNAAYLDLLQTALAAAGGPVQPRHVRLKYAKPIPAKTEQVQVRLEARGEVTRFSIEAGEVVCALGEVSGG